MPSDGEQRIVKSIDDLVGETPLLEVTMERGRFLAKLESANPYSVKDRIAREIIDAAERAGALEPRGTIVEATSGNTGIGLAAIAAAREYGCVLTMPSSMSRERRTMLRALGADLEITSAEGGMSLAAERAETIAARRDDAVLARQFANSANPTAHRATTGPEIYAATEGTLDAVVAGVGTGGTITGVGEYLVEARGLSVTMVGVEPDASPTLSAQSDASHEIQGIGPGFLPDVLRPELVDEIIAVEDATAKEAARAFATRTGLLVGISAGAAVAAAQEYLGAHPGESVVAVLPDSGERYLSTDLFDPPPAPER